jgi:hypothetical protein
MLLEMSIYITGKWRADCGVGGYYQVAQLFVHIIS